MDIFLTKINTQCARWLTNNTHVQVTFQAQFYAEICSTLRYVINSFSFLSFFLILTSFYLLIFSVEDYCCTWSLSLSLWHTHTHTHTLHVLQSKCLHIATNASWYIGNKQIHDDFGVPFFTDHIRSLTEWFDSNLADGGNPLVMQLCRHIHWPSVDSSPLEQGYRDGQLVLATSKRQPCQHIKSFPPGTFWLPCLRFSPCFSSQLEGKCQGKTCKARAWLTFFPSKSAKFFLY
jgi:hypothetical protein